MAIVNVGDISVDLNAPDLYRFPTIDIPANVGRMFGLTILPNPIPLGSPGYFLVIPLIQPGNVELERPRLTKWFPKNQFFNFKYTSPATLGDPVPTTISLYPITPFGNFAGSQVDIRLFYEDSLNEPPSLIT
jgi:hypothetical protein